jgi:hypothetical protein
MDDPWKLVRYLVKNFRMMTYLSSGDPICFAVRDTFSGVYLLNGILAGVANRLSDSSLVELEVQGISLLWVEGRTFKHEQVRIFALDCDIAPVLQHNQVLCNAGMDLDTFGLEG